MNQKIFREIFFGRAAFDFDRLLQKFYRRRVVEISEQTRAPKFFLRRVRILIDLPKFHPRGFVRTKLQPKIFVGLNAARAVVVARENFFDEEQREDKSFGLGSVQLPRRQHAKMILFAAANFPPRAVKIFSDFNAPISEQRALVTDELVAQKISSVQKFFARTAVIRAPRPPRLAHVVKNIFRAANAVEADTLSTRAAVTIIQLERNARTIHLALSFAKKI